jgi:hypothetical protein
VKNNHNITIIKILDSVISIEPKKGNWKGGPYHGNMKAPQFYHDNIIIA